MQMLRMHLAITTTIIMVLIMHLICFPSAERIALTISMRFHYSMMLNISVISSNNNNNSRLLRIIITIINILLLLYYRVMQIIQISCIPQGISHMDRLLQCITITLKMMDSSWDQEETHFIYQRTNNRNR